eukprot:14935612-Alexandrium_andersonii.AAC.1
MDPVAQVAVNGDRAASRWLPSGAHTALTAGRGGEGEWARGESVTEREPRAGDARLKPAQPPAAVHCEH